MCFKSIRASWVPHTVPVRGTQDRHQPSAGWCWLLSYIKIYNLNSDSFRIQTKKKYYLFYSFNFFFFFWSLNIISQKPYSTFLNGIINEQQNGVKMEWRLTIFDTQIINQTGTDKHKIYNYFFSRIVLNQLWWTFMIATSINIFES